MSGGRADPDAAGDERRLRVVRNGVLVDRDAGLAQHRLGDLAGEILGAEVHQHQVDSVPPDTMAKPRSTSAAASVWAFSTTRRA